MGCIVQIFPILIKYKVRIFNVFSEKVDAKVTISKICGSCSTRCTHAKQAPESHMKTQDPKVKSTDLRNEKSLITRVVKHAHSKEKIAEPLPKKVFSSFPSNFEGKITLLISKKIPRSLRSLRALRGDSALSALSVEISANLQ